MNRTEQKGTPLNQSIENACRLLGCFTPQKPELTLAEITALLGTSKATTHRYAVALRHAGLVRYDAALGLYSLGPRIIELAAGALARLDIIKVAAPHMQQLLTKVNQTVVLSVWGGRCPVVVYAVENIDLIARVVVRVGSHLQPNSAQGQIHCAYNSEIPCPGISQEELAKVRAWRLAIHDSVTGLRAIATPVFHGRQLAAALALVGTQAIVPDALESPIAHYLRGTADMITADLGLEQGGQAT